MNVIHVSVKHINYARVHQGGQASMQPVVTERTVRRVRQFERVQLKWLRWRVTIKYGHIPKVKDVYEPQTRKPKGMNYASHVQPQRTTERRVIEKHTGVQMDQKVIGKNVSVIFWKYFSFLIGFCRDLRAFFSYSSFAHFISRLY
jgi:hypothetical protein